MAETLTVVFKGVDNFSNVAGKVNGQFSRMGGIIKGAGIAGVAGLGALVGGVGLVGSKLLDLGSDAQETGSLIDASLGDAAAGFNSELRAMSSEMNRSFFEMQSGSSTIIAMTKAMGATEGQAADMGLGFSGLAADLGSFFNRADTDVFMDLQSALGGSSETLQKYGVIANETTLKQMALEQGLIATKTDALDPLMRAQLIQQAITEQASDAMGDAARTSGSWSNSMKGLKARITDAATEAGSKLIPVMTPLLNLIGDMAAQAIPFLTGAFESLLPHIQNAVSFIRGFASGLQEGMSPLNAFIEAIWDMAPPALLDKLIDFRDNILPSLMEKFALIKASVLAFIAPIQAWIANNMQLSDVLIGLGIILGGIVLSAIVSVITALAPIALIIGGVILAVAALRMAWEADFLGIRTMITEWAEEHGGIMQGIKDWWLDLQITWSQLSILIGLGAQAIKIWWLNLQVTWLQLRFIIAAGAEAIKKWWLDLKVTFLQLKTIVLVGLLAVATEWQTFKSTIEGLANQIKTIWDLLGAKFTAVGAGIRGALQPIVDLIQRISDGLAGLSLPDFMKQGSPTPWENGLRGVASAMSDLTNKDMPALGAEMQGLQNIRNQSTNISQSTIIYTSSVDTAGETRAQQRFANGGI